MADAPARADLLFEIGTEELPPRALKRLSDALSREFTGGLDAAGLTYGEVAAYCAPRRLALLIRDCATAQPDRDVERRGPALAAAFDETGRPTRAAEGFARSCGTGVDGLQRLETDKGTWLVYRVHETGRAAVELLPGIAETALGRLPIPKRMRWGDSEVQFVRPVHWLVFMLGDRVIPCTLLGVPAGNQTRGHRFHHPEPIALDAPADYARVLLQQGRVIADFDQRRQKIEAQVEAAAVELGGRPDRDADLLDEVTALNEWPAPVTGTFEARFLSVPHEALVATMKGNQKYFPVFGTDGRLLNHFITIANLDSRHPEVIREGNERVIRPRLADAMFFWEQDGKRRLEDHLPGLEQVVFQKQLGSMREKSGRVATLAAHIADKIGGDPALALRAGELSRCDLTTEMVFEFPELQGVMGRYQARRDGEPAELATAMDEFYLPRFAGDRLPGTPTGIAVSLADRLDTLVGIFGVGLHPTGDKDPFALRRAALGALRILRDHALPLNLKALLAEAEEQLRTKLTERDVAETVYGFMLDRLKGLYAEAGAAPDVFDAVAAVRPDSIADFERRVNAVGEFRRLPEAEALAAANKRIGNILRKTEDAVPARIDRALLEQATERDLFDQLAAITRETAPMMAAADYDGTLRALSRLREPVDRFFDDVMVMVEQPALRGNRLALLKALSREFLKVADVSLLRA